MSVLKFEIDCITNVEKKSNNQFLHFFFYFVIQLVDAAVSEMNQTAGLFRLK